MSWVRFPSPAPPNTLVEHAFRRSATDLAFPTFPVAFPKTRSGLVRLAQSRPLLGDRARLSDRTPRVAKRGRNLRVTGRGSGGVEIGARVFSLRDGSGSGVHVPDVVRDARRSGDLPPLA